MRAFIALELPGRFVDEMTDLAQDLRSCVEGRFMPQENYHLTLAFLGDAYEHEIASAMAALDAVAIESKPIPLSCTGLGTFGRSNDATLWLGLKPDPALTSLAKRIREELAAKDVSFDEKQFKPHITMARRARMPHGSMPALGFPHDAQATRITLFKSELTREGAIYKPLYSVELG